MTTSRSFPRTLLALALATPVHLLTLVVAGAGIALVWRGDSLWSRLIGLACLAVAVFLGIPPRRRRHRLETSELDLRRSTATVALLRKVAADVGSPPLSRCVITSEYGARTCLSRRGRTLEVGAPLWLALDNEERIALLARTMAPLGRALTRTDGYVTSALWSLGRWRDLFDPLPAHDPQAVYDPVIVATETQVLSGRAENRILLEIAWLLMWPLRVVVEGYRRLLAAVATPLLCLKDERADRAAAAAAGATAAAGLQRALGDGEVVAAMLQHATRFGGDLQTAISERTARLYADQVTTAPPGTVQVGLEVWAQIDQEWAPAVAEQFAEIRSAYR